MEMDYTAKSNAAPYVQPTYIDKSTSFTMNGKLKSEDLESLLKELDSFRQTLSSELENPSNSNVQWRVSFHLGRTG